MQGHATLVEAEAGALVLAGYQVQGLAEDLAELEHAAVVPAELLFEGFPGDAVRPAGLDAVQALRQPGVEVERQAGLGEGGDGALVERDGVALQALKVVQREAYGPGPEHALALILVQPEIEGGDELGADLDRAAAFGGAEADKRGGEAGELALEQADLGAVRVVAEQAFGEGGEAGLDLDLGAVVDQGLAVEAGQDKAGLGAEGQAELEPLPGLGIERRTGLDPQPDGAVNPLLLPAFGT